MKPIDKIDIKLIPIKDLELHPLNFRQGDIGEIMLSLKEHGQYKPIIVQKSRMRVCAGNHTLQAAAQLGWTKIAATVIDVDDDQALRILTVDNRTSDLATNDNAILIDLLESMVRSEDGLAGTGFHGDDLDELLMDEVDPEKEWDGMPEFDQPNVNSKFKAIVHFKSEEDRLAFFEHIDRPLAQSLWWPEDDGFKGGRDSTVQWESTTSEP